MKRTTAIILTFALLAGLIGCGSAASDDELASDQSSTDTETSAPVETDRSEIADNLPEADFGGYQFRIIGREDNFVYVNEQGADEQNGEIVNDAAYRRNAAVEERYNIEIVRNYKSADDIVSTVRQAVMAGDDAYDLIFNAAWSLPKLATDNLLLDWYNVKYVDFSSPWWSSEAISELTVANHSYFAIGDICMSNIGIVMCIFYNRTLGDKFGLDNVYEVVNEGRWTYDYFSRIVKDIHMDLNGDTVMDSNDLYGFGNNLGSTLQPFVFSLGARYSEKDVNDLPVITINTERFIEAFEKIYSLHLENDGVWADSDYRVPRQMFADGNIVFNTGAVYHSATLYRDMEDVVGVLPFPKADETMEKYYTCHDPNVSLLAIPSSASDPDRTGLIVEALAAESYRVLTPAFYETALKVKYSRDDETVKTLDLIKDGVTFDFVALYSTGDGEKLAQILQFLLKSGSTDLTSYYAKYAPAAESYFASIIEQYQKLD